ncbi:NADP-dependent 3-hydroxy acid dehydrogenase YdfG [Pedobacter westerhofensis]|uniref:NADP-dependent 3-hydroxy acid dehydrogenase YdfG n=1 Tax=Pedobacter westerhofensis TaxID=425512 RepID=A0A521CSJ5_9SPHI|nr:SDR family oxidoreductase [Pedobacter westerhofensis]SMO62433.1 NADP-dependent 3-hydroxy acid dehydrogenase YdfG [Pedobacter westerhofensis]
MEKTILITGASAGIGKTTAKKFAAEGWNVIATMRSPDKEQELTKLNNVFVTKIDVEDNDSIKSAIDAGIEKFGKIDVVVNNAGILVLGAFELATSDQVKTQFGVNLFGVMNTVKTIIPHFRANGSGTIINVSSQGGRITFPGMCLYHASKFAVEGFTEGISYELLPLNIRVKIVEPGSTATNNTGSYLQAKDDQIKVYEDVTKEGMDNWYKYETPAPPEDVAALIYAAATDNSDRLRYHIGEDTELYFSTRQKADQEYVDFMRNRFIPETLAVKI